MKRSSFPSIAGAVATVGLLLLAAGAEAGISSIVAHGKSYSASAEIPVFVDTLATNSIVVKGQFMDLCTGVQSSDSSFTAGIGRRVGGSNSSVEIIVGAGSAPDDDDSTITIKFLAGQETFKIRSFKTKITGYVGGSSLSCRVGDTITLDVRGNVAHLVTGTAGAMLDVADNRYDVGSRLASSTADSAKFPLKCTAEGQFTVSRSWFRDDRVASPVGEAMARGLPTLTVTVNPAPVPLKR